MFRPLPFVLTLLLLGVCSNGSAFGSGKFWSESASHSGIRRLKSSVAASGIGANWGSQTSHRLPPNIMVRMLRENGIQRIKLFDADYDSLRALARSGIEVMVGIPNDMLSNLARSSKAADRWVSENATHHLNNNVNIRSVAVGNEPFLATYNGSCLRTTYPALRNVQNALTKANHGNQVKVPVPSNADVYSSPDGLPSSSDFRADIHNYIIPIVQLLNANVPPSPSTYTPS